MTEQSQLKDNISFVRHALNERRSGARDLIPVIYLLAALYVVIGYSLIDLQPRYCGWYFAIAGAVFAAGVVWIARRSHQRKGEVDRVRSARSYLHWFGGGVLAAAAVAALAAVDPSLRGPAAGQLIVIMWGLIYFLWGVHRDRFFLVLGPILVAGSVGVGAIPHYRWTCLGAVIALGLVIAAIAARRASAAADAE